MNVKYIYRVDTLQNLKRINDFSFRGKIWDNAPDDYPHGMLKLFHDIKKSDEKIYIICFYSSLKNALANEFNAIHSNKKSKYILRCPVNAPRFAGFKWLWDDGFKISTAYLFWTKEILDNQNVKLSKSKIDFKLFEIRFKGKWIPLKDFYISKDKRNNHCVNTSEQLNVENNKISFIKKTTSIFLGFIDKFLK